MKLWVKIGDYPWWPAKDTTATASDPTSLQVVQFYGTYDLSEVARGDPTTVLPFDVDDEEKKATNDPSLQAAVQEAIVDSGDPAEVEYDAAAVAIQMAQAVAQYELDLSMANADTDNALNDAVSRKVKKEKKEKKKDINKHRPGTVNRSRVDEATHAAAATIIEKQRDKRRREQELEDTAMGPRRETIDDCVLDGIVKELSEPSITGDTLRLVFDRLSGVRITSAQLHRTGIAKIVAAVAAPFPGSKMTAAALRQVWYADLSDEVKMQLQIHRK